MLARLCSHLSYANVTATLALFVALGGGAYAAGVLPSNSVGTKQLKRNAVTSPKVKDRSLLLADLSSATARALKGQKGDPGTPGAQGATGPLGPAGPAGPAGTAVAYARITGDVAGNLVDETRSKNIADSNVTISGGAYCFTSLSFTPKHVQAPLGGGGVGFADIIRATIGPSFCPPGTTAEVYIQNAGGGGPFTNRTFYVLFDV